MRSSSALLFSCLVALCISLPIQEKQTKKAFKFSMPSTSQLREFSVRRRTSEAEMITPLVGPALAMLVGTPPQIQNLAIDTATGDTWIVDINAVQPHSYPWMFSPANSTSLKRSNFPFSSVYADINGLQSRVSGVVVDDHFANYNSSFMMRFALIELIQEIDDSADLPDPSTTGSIGFGFTASQYMDPFLPNFLAGYKHKMFTIGQYECKQDNETVLISGDNTLGYIDEKMCNTSTTVTLPLADRTNWNFAINGYTIGDLSSTTRQMVTMNTRELLTGVPSTVYNYIYKLTHAGIRPEYLWPVVDCNQTFPDLHFNVGGEDVSVPPHLYIFEGFKDHKQAKCHLMLYPMNGGGFLPSWSFGYIWVYKKCITFDFGKKQLSFSDYNAGLCDQPKANF